MLPQGGAEHSQEEILADVISPPTWSMAPTSSSTLCPKVAMRTASNSRWSGYAGTISIEALRRWEMHRNTT